MKRNKETTVSGNTPNIIHNIQTVRSNTNRAAVCNNLCDLLTQIFVHRLVIPVIRFCGIEIILSGDRWDYEPIGIRIVPSVLGQINLFTSNMNLPSIAIVVLVNNLLAGQAPPTCLL